MDTSRSPRRPAALLLGCALGVLGIAPCPAPAQAPAKSFTVWTATDVHLLAPALHDRGSLFGRVQAEGDGKDVELTPDCLDAFLAEAARAKPDVLILSGDLTFNGEAESHRLLASKLKALRAAGVKTCVIPGNHDIENPWARKFSGASYATVPSVDARGFAETYRDAGYGDALSRDPASLSYLAEPVPGLRLLMLDSARYADNEEQGYPEASGALSPAALEWAAAQIRKASADGARLVVALHHSLAVHSPMVNTGYTLDNAEEAAALFASLGVAWTLSGHIHIQDIAERKTPSGILRDIATGAFSVNPHNYGILKLEGKTGLEYRAKSADVAAWALGAGKTDKRLLDWKAYSENFFRRASEALVKRSLARAGKDAPKLTPEEAASASRVLGELNLRFFAGRQDLNGPEIEADPGFKLLSDGRFPFLGNYARSILADPTPENNVLRLP